MARSKNAAKRTRDGFGAYFLSLTVENVRCFGPEQTLDLSDGQGRHAQWTVILGENGVGKTTLLTCLAYITGVRRVRDRLVPRTDHDEIAAFAPHFSEWLEGQRDLVRGESNVHGKISSKVTYDGLEPTIRMEINRFCGQVVDLPREELDKLLIFHYGTSQKMPKTQVYLSMIHVSIYFWTTMSR